MLASLSMARTPWTTEHRERYNAAIEARRALYPPRARPRRPSVAYLLERLDQIDQRLDAPVPCDHSELVAALETLTYALSHRRIVDGGAHPREQAKAVRRLTAVR